ncbi:unnamed protein product [Moneuplotes crassus]|uniref:FHA domain-containing protein n=1 Tax=Euplotes crassus TaxID=5936 RepID=A0AAD1UKB3_EUPCR|nr:unnamed protein product [Moneuplotes crassus]
MGNKLNLCNGNNPEQHEQRLIHAKNSPGSPPRWSEKRSRFGSDEGMNFDSSPGEYDEFQISQKNKIVSEHCTPTPSSKTEHRSTRVLGENINYDNQVLPPKYPVSEENQFFNSRRISNLNLIILSDGPMKGSCLQITPNGLKGTDRDQQDGYTYFGSKTGASSASENYGYSNREETDFVIPKQESGNAHGRHFYIRYDYDEQNYKIKDLGVGSGVFMKLDYPTPLRDNHLINIGESYLIINLISTSQRIKALESDTESDDDDSFKVDRGDDIPKIRIKVFGGPNSGQVFYSNGMDTDEIKIGRSNYCNISINDEVLSKYQSKIYYDFDLGHWMIKDGGDKKCSLNGTWLYLNEEYTLYEGMKFKAHSLIFLVK